MFPQEGLLNAMKIILLPATGNAVMHLAQSIPGASDDLMTWSLLHGSGIEANYPGYSPQNMTFPSPSIVAPDDGNSLASSVHWAPSGMTTPQTIFGYWIEQDYLGSMVLLIWKRLGTPLVLSSDASYIDIQVSVYDKDFSPP